MYIFDIETLGTESTSVVLSASVIEFEATEKYTYEELLSKALFVKFNVKEQIETYNRTVDKDAISWWKKQTEYAQSISLKPTSMDLSVIQGIQNLKDYIDPKQKIWARGSLDQMVIDSLCRSAKVESISQYNNWRDIRTAIDLLKDTANNGYCDIPNFNKQDVIKHHPTHDCAYDIMMLLYGK